MDTRDPHDQLVASGWNPVALELAIRTGFRCEYCQKDFFGDLEDYYSFQIEHIVPRGIGGETPENLTVACSTCNFLKRRWNPRKVAGENASRAELIAVAKDCISERRRNQEAKVSRERAMVKQLLAQIGK